MENFFDWLLGLNEETLTVWQIDEGHVLDKALRHNRIGQNDLLAALRKNGHTSDFSRLKAVYMERDGSISVIPANREPQVIEIQVHEGVQVVRIEMQ